MSVATTSAALPTNPDPPQGPRVEHAGDTAPPHSNNAPPHAPTAPAPQSHAARVLLVLRQLIAFGQDLARTVQEHTAAGTLLSIAVRFNARDFALILARIARGLRLAHALEAKLLSRPVREARDDGAPAPVRAPAERVRRTPRPRAPRPALPDVPTAEEIAAALRGRPAGSVIADICRDLGLLPSHKLWREVVMLLSRTGHGLSQLYNNLIADAFGWPPKPGTLPVPGWAIAPLRPVPAGGTGPP